MDNMHRCHFQGLFVTFTGITCCRVPKNKKDFDALACKGFKMYARPWEMQLKYSWGAIKMRLKTSQEKPIYYKQFCLKYDEPLSEPSYDYEEYSM